MNKPDFCEETHTYRAKGSVVPSVTQILAPVYDFSKIPKNVLEIKRQLGIEVHLACSMLAMGALDPDTIEVEIAPYVFQFQQFLDDVHPEVVSIERREVSKVYGYTIAGCSDLVLHFNGSRNVVDIKCGPESPVVGLQTAAYAQLHEENGLAIKGRFGLHITPLKYSLVEYCDPSDLSVFLALKQVHDWRKKWNI